MEKKIKNRNVKIIVATHKKYQMPTDDMYIPLQVGKEGKENIGYTCDNTGDNISNRNPYYCELTGLYWGWKNLKTDYMGLVHYRRNFTKGRVYTTNKEKRLNCVLSKEQINKLLDKTDIVLPKKRNYYIESLYSHYAHTHYVEALDETRKVIEEKKPKYLKEFDKLHTRKSAHMFNMFIMKKEILNEYCTWLFDILFELEKRIDPTQYDSFHARYLGRVSELLLDVWINTNGLEYIETNVVNIEGENWIKKGTSFLEAKFTGKKYGKSF